MVAPNCLSSVDICMIRVAGLTAAGAPRTGAHGYITDSPESAKLGTVDDTVNETIRKNGCGRIVTRVPPQTSVKGAQMSVDLTIWERSLIQLLVGGDLLITGGNTGGWKAPKLEDGQVLPVCIEFYSRAWDGSNQAVTAISTPNVSYHCWVMSFVRCSLSQQFTLATGDTVFTITGEGSENPNITVNGPWNDWPAWVVAQGGFDSAFGEYDTPNLPTPNCGFSTVPSGS